MKNKRPHCVLMSFVIVVTLVRAQDARGQSFGFQRIGGEAEATASANVLLNSGNFDNDMPPDQFDDVFAAQAAMASVSETEPRDHSGFAQASSEAQINIPTGATGFGPTMNVVAAYQVMVTNEVGPQNGAVAEASPSTDASFMVTGDDGANGLFEGRLMLAAPGDYSDVSANIMLSAIINVGSAQFSISASTSGVNQPYDVTTTTPSGTLTSTSTSLNEFLFISASVAPGDSVTMQTSINGTVSAMASNGGASQGQVFPIASAFGYAAELPGDFDDDGDVDGEDLDDWEGAFGETVPPGTSADVNGDGVVAGADFLVWQRHLGETTQSGNPVPVPQSLSILSLMGIILWRRRLS